MSEVKENKEVTTIAEQPSQVTQSRFSRNQLAENTITDNMALPKLKGARVCV
jgi:hypothetical protein